MRWNLKRLLVVVVAAVSVLYPPIIQAQKAATSRTDMQTLRWKNGDALPGNLLKSASGVGTQAARGLAVQWSSPYFSDDLIVDIGVLDSIVFPKQSVPATEAFRVGTVSGDIWIADIVDSDADTFLFSSERHGRFRVNREAIYSLERREHPNLIFDGSQFTNWEFPKRNAKEPRVLFGVNAFADWYPDRSGHLRTDKVKAKIFYALDWPQHFEIDLELGSATRPPGFVFALGKNLYEALRLETWVNELVVVQGTLFEPVLTIQPDRRNFRLRLAYNGDTRVLEVFDYAGNLLLKLGEVGQTTKESGVYIYNRGQNLTVRRLRVYRQPLDSTKQQIDASKPRVHMMNGQVVYGKLFVERESAYMLDDDGNRYDIDIQQIDRVVQPGAALVEMEHSVALTYPDGAVLRGEIAQVNPESVLLQTAFATEPVVCMFAGASQLRVESIAHKKNGQIEDEDRLFHPSGNLRGRVHFDLEGGSFIRWKPVGASKTVRLANIQQAEIERNNRRASKKYPFDTSQFRHILHLKSGEIIPCQISSYNEKGVGFQSPFISAPLINSADVKALEFSGRTHANYIDRARSTNSKGSYTVFGHGENIKIEEIEWKIEGKDQQLWIEGDELPNLEMFLKEDGKVDVLKGGEIKIILNGRELELNSNPQDHQLDVKLERALTVPRFNRDTPPSHILVAENGDMKRGKLLGFNGETIRFDSKLRQFSVPIDRVARVVDVSKEAVSRQSSAVGKGIFDRPKASYIVPQAQTRLASSRKQGTAQSDVCVRLTDGSILIFEPLEIKDDTLLGRSSIYGEIEVPIESIKNLYLGDTTAAFEAAFAAWVVRPAKEPVFGDEP